MVKISKYRVWRYGEIPRTIEAETTHEAVCLYAQRLAKHVYYCHQDGANISVFICKGKEYRAYKTKD